MADTWTMLTAERRALADYLSTLDLAAWDERSLCAEWTVKHVAAHVVAGEGSTLGSFATGLLSSGFSFDKAADKAMEAELLLTPEALVAKMRELSTNETKPGKAMVGEAIVHTEDIRRALGAGPGPHDLGAVILAADYYKGSGKPIRGKKRIAGVTLKATDTAWTTGTGPLVEGPMLSLLLAIAGRTAAHADLAGPGLATLASRS